MGDWRQFISVVKESIVPTGRFRIKVETLDSNPLGAFTVEVSGEANDTEIKMATRIQNAMNTAIDVAGYQYLGQPRFSSEVPTPSFQVNRTEHVVSIWSESQFQITVEQDDSGAIIPVTETAVIETVREAKDTATILGISLADRNGTPFTDEQIASLLGINCDRLLTMLNNNIVVCTYKFECSGAFTSGAYLGVTPVVNFDMPWLRRPGLFNADVYTFMIDKASFNLIPKTGLLKYRHTNNILNAVETFDKENEVKITYRAGYPQIPAIIKEKVIQITAIFQSNTNIASLKGGSFEIKYTDPEKPLKMIMSQLGAYQL